MSAALLHLLHQAFFGGLAAFGFAVLFNCRPRMLIHCFCAGALALAVRTLAQELGFSLAGASFLAALLLAVVDKFWRESPTSRNSVLAVVGSIPMIPGSLAAKVLVSVLIFVRTGQSSGVEATIATWDNLVLLIATLAAIGTALALPSLIPAVKINDDH